MTEPDPVAALAAQLGQLRGQLARAQGEIGHLRERLTEDSGQALMLRLEVKRLTEQLAGAIASHKTGTPPAPYWAGLSKDELAAQLAGLKHWVDRFLRVHYPGYADRLPACWAAHGEAIWELSTLRAEWERIYGDEDNRDLAGALMWHDRWFPGVLSRLNASIKCDLAGCRMVARYPPRP